MKTILFQGDSITDCCRPRERGKTRLSVKNSRKDGL